MITIHDPLYKKTSTGALQFWRIAVKDNVIITTWGQVGGKEQETRDVVKQGKNTGKKNETTPAQQAEAEALSQWEKKLKKGYVRTQAEAQAGTVDEIIEGGISPMLAHRFDEQGHKIVYPALAQPKFDGHRCIAVAEGGEVSLWSRTRKPITGVPHILRELEALLERARIKDAIIDGELYNHDYRTRFEELTSFIRQVEPKPGHEVVQYHIYDLVDVKATVPVGRDQKTRLLLLRELMLARRSEPSLVEVETREVADEDELTLAFEGFLAQGYEGLMVRNAAGLYVNKRSYDLQKVKEFADAEFPIIGVEEGRGKLAGHAIFVCKTADNVQFRVKLKGETAALKGYFDNPTLVIGRMLTVKYQGLTAKSTVPRFPVGVRIREDV
jgi:DNA ligase 1